MDNVASVIVPSFYKFLHLISHDQMLSLLPLIDQDWSVTLDWPLMGQDLSDPLILVSDRGSNKSTGYDYYDDKIFKNLEHFWSSKYWLIKNSSVPSLVRFKIKHKKIGTVHQGVLSFNKYKIIHENFWIMKIRRFFHRHFVAKVTTLELSVTILD